MQKECLICSASFADFEEYGIPSRKGKCPECGAKPRHRTLALFLQDLTNSKFANQSWKILEIGPSKVMTKHIVNSKFLGRGVYTAVDIRELRHHKSLRAPHSFQMGDVCDLPFAAESFDLILCNNVLPFLPDYQKALSELDRCLKSGGLMMANSFFLAKHPTRPTSELQSLDPNKYNEKFIEENGTFWVFGADLFDTFSSLGLRSELRHPHKKLPDGEGSRFGLKISQELILCSKPA